jgi:hypothetical protein
MSLELSDFRVGILEVRKRFPVLLFSFKNECEVPGVSFRDLGTDRDLRSRRHKVQLTIDVRDNRFHSLVSFTLSGALGRRPFSGAPW